jgi:Lon protease-like protein
MMPRELPLFPLNVVLFPGARLPLHIFEPRYRQLLVDCGAEDDCFGLCLPGGGDGGAPAAGTIGTVAEILFRQVLPDGRSNIIIEGRERFVVTGIVEDGTPYAMATVDAVTDFDTQVPGADAAELQDRFTEYRQLLARFIEEEIDDAPLSDDAETLSFQASAGIDCDLEDKLQLLVAQSAAARVTRLLELLDELIPALTEAVRLREGARSNGLDRSEPPSN